MSKKLKIKRCPVCRNSVEIKDQCRRCGTTLNIFNKLYLESNDLLELANRYYDDRHYLKAYLTVKSALQLYISDSGLKLYKKLNSSVQ